MFRVLCRPGMCFCWSSLASLFFLLHRCFSDTPIESHECGTPKRRSRKHCDLPKLVTSLLGHAHNPAGQTEFGRQEAPTSPSWASSFRILIMLSTIQAVSSISIAHRTGLQHHVVWESAVTNVLMSWPVSPGFVSGNTQPKSAAPQAISN